MKETRVRHIDSSWVAQNTVLVDGFPRPDWNAIDDWIDRNVKDCHADEAWTEAGLCWLDAVKEHLAGQHKVYASDHFYLLCPYEKHMANKLISFAEDAWGKIHQYLRQLELDRPCGKEVILAFADQDTYYTYISYFEPEGEFGFTSGMHIRRGYEHVVLAPDELWQLEFALTHELTHAVLCTLPMPEWLEEGLAQILEELVLSRPSFTIDAEIKRQHDRYWHRHGLDKFWSGETFNLPDEGQGLGYALAQILVRNMAGDHGDRFFDFVQAARREDAGEAAAREHLKCSLSDCAMQFLGEGDWAPRPEVLRDAAEREDSEQPDSDGQ